MDLGLGDDVGLEGIGEDDVSLREIGFKESVEPRPVHGVFENHASAGVAFDEVDEELRGAVVDATPLEDAVGGINRAKNAVSLMEVDSDIDWEVGLFIGHPSYNIHFINLRSPIRPQIKSASSFHVG